MKIMFLFRSEGTGFSIEQLFTGLMKEIGHQTHSEIRSVTMPYIGSSLGKIWKNLRFARRNQADIYHITGDVHYLALALPANRTVLTIHDCVMLTQTLQNRQYISFSIFWAFWYFIPILKADKVTTISQKTKIELERYVGRRLASKIKVIDNWSDPAFLPLTKRFNSGNPVILHIGSAPHKNLLRLIEALEGIPCHLEIIAALTDETKVYLQRYNIMYTQSDHLNLEEVIWKYQQCDLVAFVSTYEGFGMPVIEANAVGKPVLTSNLSPMREVAGLGAHLVDPFDVQAIRNGILKIINDEHYRNQLIDSGFENARRFTRSQIAAQYIKLYDQIKRNES
jgi:glycosyltransferase involved in cell wall biosynthesis